MFDFALTVNSILSEVFSTNGGDIDSIRVSGRGFCHIRFQKEESVEKALSLAGEKNHCYKS